MPSLPPADLPSPERHALSQLMRRAAFYAAVAIVPMFCCLVGCHVLVRPGAGLVEALFAAARRFGPVLIVLIGLAPIAVWDLYRAARESLARAAAIRHAIGQLAAGKVPPPVPAEGDVVFSTLAKEVNLLAAALRRERRVRAARTGAEREAVAPGSNSA